MPKKSKPKSADPQAEIQKLKKEVAKLKREMALLQKFFSYTKLDEAHGDKSMTLFCHQLVLQKLGGTKSHGSLSGGNDGASLHFFDEDMKTRLHLSVREDAGHMLIVGPTQEVAIEMGATNGKHGYIAVCDEGNPRVALRTTEQGGAVTVNHDDGLVRAYMESHVAGGRVIISNSDMKPAVELGADPQDGAGYVLANNPMGKPGAMLASDGEQGVVTLFDSQENPTCHLPGK